MGLQHQRRSAKKLTSCLRRIPKMPPEINQERTGTGVLMFTWRQSASAQSECTSRANKSSRLPPSKKITKEIRKEPSRQSSQAKQQNHPTSQLLLSSSPRFLPPTMVQAFP